MKAMLNVINDLKLKRGDLVRVTFKNGNMEDVKIKDINFNCRQVRDNHLVTTLTISDTKYYYDLLVSTSIEVLERSNRSKKVILDNNKQFQGRLEWLNSH